MQKGTCYIDPENILYSRDLLYPTDVPYEPGNIHIKILNPNKKARLPVVIESKTEHSPVKHIDSIVRIMQAEIFDRILINIRNCVNLYIKLDENMSIHYKNKKFLLVVFENDRISYREVDEIE